MVGWFDSWIDRLTRGKSEKRDSKRGREKRKQAHEVNQPTLLASQSQRPAHPPPLVAPPLFFDALALEVALVAQPQPNSTPGRAGSRPTYPARALRIGLTEPDSPNPQNQGTAMASWTAGQEELGLLVRACVCGSDRPVVGCGKERIENAPITATRAPPNSTPSSRPRAGAQSELAHAQPIPTLDTTLSTYTHCTPHPRFHSKARCPWAPRAGPRSSFPVCPSNPYARTHACMHACLVRT